jgi:LysM repeat protein
MYNIEWKGSPNYRTQLGVKKKFIVFHWIVGNLDSATAHFKNPKAKSATNYGVGEGRIHQYVKDKDYAFGSGDYKANRYGISIEHEGGWLLKNGQRKKPTKKTLETSAWLVAKLAREHKMGKLVPFKNAFPHKHYVNTACPGTLDWKWICEEANRINEAIAEANKPKPPVVEPEKPTIEKPATDTKKYIVVKKGDSYWAIAARVLEVSNTPKNYAKIAKKVTTLVKLNKNKKLIPNDKIRIA